MFSARFAQWSKKKNPIYCRFDAGKRKMSNEKEEKSEIKIDRNTSGSVPTENLNN